MEVHVPKVCVPKVHVPFLFGLVRGDLQEKAILLRPLLSDARHVDRRVIHDRAFGLADAAADAQVEVHDRRFLRRDRPIGELGLDHDEFDGLG